MTVIRTELSFFTLRSSTFCRPLRTSFSAQARSEWMIYDIYQKTGDINKTSAGPFREIGLKTHLIIWPCNDANATLGD